MVQIDMPEDTEKSILARLLIEQRAMNYLLARILDYNNFAAHLELAYDYAINGKTKI